MCQGLTYDDEVEEITLLIRGKMGEARTSDNGDFFDAILLRLSSSGQIRQRVGFTHGGFEYDFFMASGNALATRKTSEGDLVHFFGGTLPGYSTVY